MPYTPPYGTHRLRRARTTRSGPTGEFFFLSIVFFKSNYTHSLWMSPRHRHAIYFTHTASTGCVGPERLGRALQVSFFFLLVFFFNSNYTHSLRKSPTCHILHPYGTHRLRRARTTPSGPTGGFFFFFLFFFVFTK